jgi:hypothetical protein
LIFPQLRGNNAIFPNSKGGVSSRRKKKSLELHGYDVDEASDAFPLVGLVPRLATQLGAKCL